MRVVAGIIGGNQGVPEWVRTVYIDTDDVRLS